jgi:hypothetical protein
MMQDSRTRPTEPAQTPAPALAAAAPPEVLKAPCPKCHNEMVYVTHLPHPLAPQMQRTTFLCVRCNQTRSYALSAKMAAAYAALAPKMT